MGVIQQNRVEMGDRLLYPSFGGRRLEKLDGFGCQSGHGSELAMGRGFEACVKSWTPFISNLRKLKLDPFLKALHCGAFKKGSGVDSERIGIRETLGKKDQKKEGLNRSFLSFY